MPARLVCPECGNPTFTLYVRLKEEPRRDMPKCAKCGWSEDPEIRGYDLKD